MELHLMELYVKFNFHKYFHYILQLIYQSSFFYTYNFYNLNILSNIASFITFTLTIIRVPNKSLINYSFAN